MLLRVGRASYLFSALLKNPCVLAVCRGVDSCIYSFIQQLFMEHLRSVLEIQQ